MKNIFKYCLYNQLYTYFHLINNLISYQKVNLKMNDNRRHHNNQYDQYQSMNNIQRRRVSTEDSYKYNNLKLANNRIINHSISNSINVIKNRNKTIQYQSKTISNRNPQIQYQQYSTIQQQQKRVNNSKKIKNIGLQTSQKQSNIAQEQIKRRLQYSSDGSQENKSIQQNIKQDKDQILKRMQDRNEILKDQIFKIQKMEQLMKLKQKSKHKNQRSFQQIYYEFSTKDSLKKQLQNAYYKIKNMEAQIQTLRSLENTDHDKKISKLKDTLQQVEKARNERTIKLAKAQKQSKKREQSIQKYKNRGGFKEKIIELREQAELLKQKQKQIIFTQQKRKQRFIKQQSYIRKLQKELADNGLSREYIQDLMNRILYRDKSKDNYKSKQKEIATTVHATRQQSQQKIKKEYLKMDHQINILKKSIKEQQKTINQVMLLQKQSLLKYQKSKQMCQQFDEKIRQIEQQIAKARKAINPALLKPKPLPPKQPTLQDFKQQQRQHLKQVRMKFYEKKAKNYMKGLENLDLHIQNQPNQNKSNQQISQQQKYQNQFKQTQHEMRLQTKQIDKQDQYLQQIKNIKSNLFQIFGKLDENGVQFSDKNIYQKLDQQCRITGITVFISDIHFIIGIKAQYNYQHQSSLHRYTLDNHVNDKNFINQTTEQFNCIQQQFITSISGTFSYQYSTQILINLTVLTNLNRYHKFGSLILNQNITKSPKNQTKINKKAQEIQNQIKRKQDKSFDISTLGNTRPVYILGCINKIGVCQFGAAVIQQNEQEYSQSHFLDE